MYILYTYIHIKVITLMKIHFVLQFLSFYVFLKDTNDKFLKKYFFMFLTVTLNFLITNTFISIIF